MNAPLVVVETPQELATIDASKKRLPVITTSSGRCYRRCPREYQFRYEMSYSSIERAQSLRFGGAVHAGLEALWTNGWLVQSAITVALDQVSDPFDAARIEVSLLGYLARWKDEPFELVAAEKEFRAPLVNPDTGAPSKTWELAGKLDVLVRDHRGLVWIMEHKTSSEDISCGSQYWEKLRLDSQISNYFNGARSLGFEPEGVIYDVLKKLGLKPLKATPIESRKYKKDGTLYAAQREQDETPEGFKLRLIETTAENPDGHFVRGEVVRLEQEEIESARDVWQLGKFIRESQLSNRWPRNPEACSRYGRMCEFWPVCTKTADLTDETRFAKTKPHQELELVA
jgi:hypothetical protein